MRENKRGTAAPARVDKVKWDRICLACPKEEGSFP